MAVQFLHDGVPHLLVVLGLPDAIAAHQDELHVPAQGFGDFRHRDDYLLGSGQQVVGLEVEIADGSGQVQVVVDSAVSADEAACSGDSGLLAGQPRLVVVAQASYLEDVRVGADGGYGTTVAGIRAVDVVMGDEDYVCGAACEGGAIIEHGIALLEVHMPDVLEFFLAGRRQHDFIQF